MAKKEQRPKNERNAIRQIMKATGVKYTVALRAFQNTKTEEPSQE
jgi:hypothetical protein